MHRAALGGVMIQILQGQRAGVTARQDLLNYEHHPTTALARVITSGMKPNKNHPV
jgi:hypothetical protein